MRILTCDVCGKDKTEDELSDHVSYVAIVRPYPDICKECFEPVNEYMQKKHLERNLIYRDGIAKDLADYLAGLK